MEPTAEFAAGYQQGLRDLHQHGSDLIPSQAEAKRQAEQLRLADELAEAAYRLEGALATYASAYLKSDRGDEARAVDQARVALKEAEAAYRKSREATSG